MKKFLNRWILLSVGLFCISMLIWFLSPLIVIGNTAPFDTKTSRILAILILVILWSLNNLLLIYLARRRSKKITAELSGIDKALPDPANQQEAEREVAAMAMGFEQAARTLKLANRSGVGNKKYLYEIPWYLTLGTPGAGKTTVLRNSGLRFSLIRASELRSWQAKEDNRNCQWWFTDDAVIIDSAGRQTIQDDNPMVDMLTWQKLLALLREYRPQRPVDGIIIVISMADLMNPDSGVCSTNADVIRQRLRELSLAFKKPIPAYCLVTKCDQVAGFVEFFDNLDQKAREQVWGITFGLGKDTNTQARIEQFDAEYERLIERVQLRLFEHLENETDIERRAKIHGFPTQMQILRPSLNSYLTDIFRPGRFDGHVQLRGVYFTSGTQVGAPSDPLTSFVSSTFGITAPPLPDLGDTASGYFLKSLFTDVIFRDSNLAIYAPTSNRRRRLIRQTVAAGAAIMLIAMGFAWLISFNRNQDYISTVEAKVVDFDNRSGTLTQDVEDISSPLSIFDLLRAMPGGYADRERSTPLAASFGLSQRDKLGSAASAAYQRVLQSTLLPRLIFRLEKQIKESFDKPELLHEALKIYLMLEDPTRFDYDAVRLWYKLDVDLWLPGGPNADRRSALRSHLAALFEQRLKPPPPDSNLVATARQILAAVSVAERAYARIKNDVQSGDSIKAWTLRQKLGRTADRVFDPTSVPTVPGFYTVDAYRNVFPQKSLRVVKEITNDAWVVGLKDSDVRYETLHDDVLDLYLADYANHWDSVLRNTRLVALSDRQQIIQVLDNLTGDNAMLRRFLEEVARQTRLSHAVKDSADPAESNSDKVKAAATALAQQSNKARQTSNRLARLQATLPNPTSTSDKADPALFIDQRYVRIHRLVEPGEDGKLKIDRLVSDFETFGRRQIEAIANRERAAQQTSGNDIDTDIALAAIRLVEPLRNWARQITDRASSLSGRRTQSRINENWKSQVRYACRNILIKSYPFKSDSPADLPLTEFTRFFGPNGLFDKFFKENLDGLIDTSSRPWKAQTNGQGSPLISRRAVKTFERATLIRRLFFQNGGEPQYSFVLVPVSLDQTASKFQLELGDQRITYRHGPARSRQLTWPGSKAIQGARVVFTSFAPGNPTASLAMRGVWGWFRMLNRFRDSSKANQIKFDVKNFRAIYAINPSNPAYIPVLRLFRRFSCPNAL